MPDAHLLRRTAVAYVPQDKGFLPFLEEGLKTLHHKHLLTSWNFYNVEGEQSPLLGADILLLLVSPFLVASPFFSQTEEDLLRMYKAGMLCIIPIHLQPTLWYDRPLAALQSLPTDGFGGTKALTEWKEKNRRFVLENMQGEIIHLITQFEQTQLMRMATFLQDTHDALVEHRFDELMKQKLPGQLFALCERLGPILPEQMVHTLDQLAYLTQDDQREFSRRCSELALALRAGKKQGEGGRQDGNSSTET